MDPIGVYAAQDDLWMASTEMGDCLLVSLTQNVQMVDAQSHTRHQTLEEHFKLIDIGDEGNHSVTVCLLS